MTKSTLIFAFFLMLLSTMITAQGNDVQVIINVIPPYSHKVYEYIENDKVIITLIYNSANNDEIDVYLLGEISNDSGDRVFTDPDFKPAVPITLISGSPFTITPDDMGDIFSINHVSTEGDIDKYEFFSGAGIPEGTYNICIRVHDYTTGIPVSQEYPEGCSPPFDILNLEPPELIMPECGTVITVNPEGDNSEADQSKLFTWVMLTSTAMPLEFRLEFKKVAGSFRSTFPFAEINENEIYIEAEPADIMNDPNVFIEYTTITSATAVYVDPGLYDFEPGYTYIFTVTAIDPDGDLSFQNNGVSEVCWITYKEKIVDDETEFEQIHPGLIDGFINDFELIPNTVISGQMLYKLFSDADITSMGGESVFIETETEEPEQENGENYQNTVDLFLTQTGNLNGNSASLSGITTGSWENQIEIQRDPPYATGYINGATVYTGGAEPLRNTKISLVVRYCREVENGFYKPSELISNQWEPHNVYIDVSGNEVGFDKVQRLVTVEKILDVTTTDNQGNFEFDFRSDFITGPFFEGLSGPEDLANRVASNMFDGFISLRIEVQHQKFCSPDIDIFAQRGDVLDIPPQVALLKDYNLNIKVTSAFDEFSSDHVNNPGDQFYHAHDINPKIIPGGSPIPNAIVKVVRDMQELGNEHPSILLAEGQQLGSTTENEHGVFKDVFIGRTDENGLIEIPNLVMHWFISDGGYGSFPYLFSVRTREDNVDNAYDDNTAYNFEHFFGSMDRMFSNSNDKFEELDADTWDLAPTTYNHFYNSPGLVERRVDLMALKPEIKGRVMLESNLEPSGLSDIAVALFTQPEFDDTPFESNMFEIPQYYQKTAWTNNSGFFRHYPLEVNVDQNGNARGPFRRIQIDESEYVSQIHPPLNEDPWNLIYGQLKDIGEVYLEPKNKMKGEVVDELGNPVQAYLRILEDGVEYPYVKTVTTTPAHTSYFTSERFEVFPIQTQGVNRIEILPLSGQYFADTIDVVWNDLPPDKFKKVTVYRKMHRLKLHVKNKVTGGTIENADVVVGDSMAFGKTNQFGEVELLFASPGQQFRVTVTSDNYSPTQESFNIPAGNDWTYRTMELEPARSIKGIVTEKVTGEPINGALVYIRMQSTDNISVYLEAFTNVEGNYQLNGIPMDRTDVDIHVVKDGKNPSYIGISQNVEIGSTFAYPEPSFDFQLTAVNMDLSNIWGFPVSIESMKQKPGMNPVIGGFFHDMPHLPTFSTLNQNEKIYFKNIQIQDGSASIVPVEEAITTSTYRIPIKIVGGFEGTFYRPFQTSMLPIIAPVSLKKNGDLGKMEGALKLDLAAFNFAYDFDGTFFIGKDTLDNRIDVFRSLPTNNFGIVQTSPKYFVFELNSNLSPIPISNFRVFGFDASSNFEDSYLQNEIIRVGAILHTDIPMANNEPSLDLKINVGVIEITQNNIDVKPHSNHFISFDLEEWKVESSSGWDFDKTKDAIIIPQAMLYTGLGVDLPLKNLNIRPNALREAEPDLTEGLSLGGIVDLTLAEGLTPTFSFDAGVGHYRISAVGDSNGPAAYTENPLPDTYDEFGNPKGVEFSSIGMLSDNTTVLSVRQSLNFYKIMDVYVDQIISGSGFFQLFGMPDLGIPGMVPASAVMTYRLNSNNNVEARMEPLSAAVDCNANTVYSVEQVQGRQNISHELYTAYGDFHIKPPAGQGGQELIVKGKLTRTPDACIIDVNPNQIVKFGKEPMEVIEGQISVSNDAWGELVFDCNTNSTGLDSTNVVTYTVHGGIAAGGDGVKVDKIESPLGEMSLAYLFDEQALVGELIINANLNMGFASLEGGMMGMRFDPNGFHMGISADLKIGAETYSGGFILGDYDQSLQAFANTLLQSFEHNQPEFPSLHGFYAIGQRCLVNESFTLVDGVLDIGIKAGVGAYVKLDYQDFEFVIGGYGFAKGQAGVNLGVPPCYVGGAACAVLDVSGHYDSTGLYVESLGTTCACASGCGLGACIGIANTMIVYSNKAPTATLEFLGFGGCTSDCN